MFGDADLRLSEESLEVTDAEGALAEEMQDAQPEWI
jgi:hypothetical protein